MVSVVSIIRGNRMIEYILAMIVLGVVILFLSGLGTDRRNSRIPRDHSDDYQGVYSHGAKSVDTEVHFPVFKDFSGIFPMNKREERKKTETHQPR